MESCFVDVSAASVDLWLIRHGKNIFTFKLLHIIIQILAGVSNFLLRSGDEAQIAWILKNIKLKMMKRINTQQISISTEVKQETLHFAAFPVLFEPTPQTYED